METERTQVSLRISHKTLRQAEALVPKLADDPRYDGIKLCRAAVLRMALASGLRALRRERGARASTDGDRHVAPDRAVRSTRPSREIDWDDL